MGTSGNTSNRGGVAVSGINFLDGGGATPLLNNTLPPNGTNQYLLVTHLYQYFGGLLGCSMMGTADFPAYSGHSSQYNVHKFMDLTYAQTTYFINQVALSASSFGMSHSYATFLMLTWQVSPNLILQLSASLLMVRSMCDVLRTLPFHRHHPQALSLFVSRMTALWPRMPRALRMDKLKRLVLDPIALS